MEIQLLFAERFTLRRLIRTVFLLPIKRHITSNRFQKIKGLLLQFVIIITPPKSLQS